MKSILSIVLIIIFFVIVPFMLGLLFETIFDRDREGVMFSRCFVSGTAIMLGVFQVIAVPMIVAGTSFELLRNIWMVIIAGIIIVTMYCLRKTFVLNIKTGIVRIRDSFIALKKNDKAIAIAAILLIVFETFLLVLRMHTDTDDSRFIAEALEAVEKNSLLRINPITGEALTFPIGEMLKDAVSPYPVFIGVMSSITMVHPAAVAHMVMPLFLIPLAFAAVYVFAEYLFKDSDRIPVFMFVFAVIVLFSFESIYSWGYTLLTIIWQGRSFASMILYPFLWYILSRIYVEEFNRLMLIPLTVTGFAAASLSGMGCLMVPLIGGCFAVAYVLKNRKLIPAVFIVLCVIPCGIYSILFTILGY